MPDEAMPWIEWAGGERPVTPDTRVQIRFRSGGTRTRRAGDSLSWDHGGEHPSKYDVVAYRIKEPRP